MATSKTCYLKLIDEKHERKRVKLSILSEHDYDVLICALIFPTDIKLWCKSTTPNKGTDSYENPQEYNQVSVVSKIFHL